MRRMRWILGALFVAGVGSAAQAADLPVLRGSNSFVVGTPQRWDGLYFGAQFGGSVTGTDFTNATNALQNMLAGGIINTVTAFPLGTDDRQTSHFGGFIGFNTSWDGAVLGIEGNYNRYHAQMSSTTNLTGTYTAPDGSSNPFSATGSTTARITDVATFRVRGGWDAGNFMPYAFAGFAVAKAEIDRSVTTTLVPPVGLPAPAPTTSTTSETGQFAYGWTLGVGLDFALMKNLFVRAEYEYVQFGDFQQVNMHMHNARVAAAFKF